MELRALVSQTARARSDEVSNVVPLRRPSPRVDTFAKAAAVLVVPPQARVATSRPLPVPNRAAPTAPPVGASYAPALIVSLDADPSAPFARTAVDFGRPLEPTHDERSLDASRVQSTMRVRRRQVVDFEANVLRRGYFKRRLRALLVIGVLVLARPWWWNIGDARAVSGTPARSIAPQVHAQALATPGLPRGNSRPGM